jgi:transcriptional regulator with XRE-family HTH domain
MDPKQIKRCRKVLGLSQGAFAQALGLSRTAIELYERGTRRDDPTRVVEIPRTVELACAALMLGIRRYSGPDETVQDDLRVNVEHLIGPDGDLVSEVNEWLDKNVQGHLRVINKEARFSSPSEAIHFKLRWSPQNFFETE